MVVLGFLTPLLEDGLLSEWFNLLRQLRPIRKVCRRSAQALKGLMSFSALVFQSWALCEPGKEKYVVAVSAMVRGVNFVSSLQLGAGVAVVCKFGRHAQLLVIY